jgi:hypothetical protein
MQVERRLSGLSGARVSNTWLTYLKVGDNVPKGMLIPYKLPAFRKLGEKFRRFERGLRAIS